MKWSGSCCVGSWLCGYITARDKNFSVFDSGGSRGERKWTEKIVRKQASKGTRYIVSDGGRSRCPALPSKISKSRMPKVPLVTSQSGPPNGQIRWYFNGPTGLTCSISLQRLPNSGGHLHPGGPVGTAQPSSFKLQGAYPQNVIVMIHLSEAAGTIIQIGRWSNGQSTQN